VSTWRPAAGDAQRALIRAAREIIERNNGSE
jgi:hypothetical protein